MQLVCPHCHAINRIPPDRTPAQAHCGKCKKPLFIGQPLELNQAAFERFLSRNDTPLVVDFWADWCGPCKMMAPAFKQAAIQIEPRARLIKINTETEQALAARYQIRSIPTLMVFSGGKETARLSGALDQSSLLSWINQNI